MSWMLAVVFVSVFAPRGEIDFARLRDQVLPERVERWQSIPWQTDLLAARVSARRDGKLLFLWAMNGHPCGST